MVVLLVIKSAFKNSLGVLCKEVFVISIMLIYFQFFFFLLNFKSPVWVVCLNVQVVYT